MKEQILLINGIGFATVARTESWYFRLLGMFLERADKTSRIVDVKYHILLPSPALVGSPMDYLHWSALLKSVSGFNTYRRLYGNLEASKVVEFLILNDVFTDLYFIVSPKPKFVLEIFPVKVAADLQIVLKKPSEHYGLNWSLLRSMKSLILDCIST